MRVPLVIDHDAHHLFKTLAVLLFLVAAESYEKKAAASSACEVHAIKGLVGGFRLNTTGSGSGIGSGSASARKLLQFDDGAAGGDGGEGEGEGGGDMNGSTGGKCSKDDITIYQGPTDPLPNGIPTYTVQILNVCVSDCSISDIHVSCGWFSSAKLINPSVFRRIYYDDCLVNDGGPLGPGQSLSFQYANTYQYPLSVSSVAC